MIKIWISFCLIGLVTLSSCVESAEESNQTYSFAIDYETNQFMLDGKPFRYVAGTFHYFRAPHQYWRDILKKIRAAGLNAVETYIEWSTHEPEFNKWIWDGDANIEEFIKIAAEEDLFVILRPGPYICAERDFGGFPYWLLNVAPAIKLRTRDERYLEYAERYLFHVLTKIKPFLRGNGGPVIMVQIENEYGSFNACDSVYMKKLHEIFNRYVGKDAVLFTTDGPYEYMLRCGTIPGVYGTIDFGSETNMTRNFEVMRKFTPKGPLVNSEYYSGWLSHWKQPLERVKTDAVTKMLDELLSHNVSVTIYVFYGGTNFGFSSGANIYGKEYSPQLTSYDYDAPLDEARDPTDKYFAIRDVVLKYLPRPSVEAPMPSAKGDYGDVRLEPTLNLFSDESRRIFGTVVTHFPEPPSFEFLGMPHWLALYESELEADPRDPVNKTLEATVKDRALVYVNYNLTGTLSRMDNSRSLELPRSDVPAQLSVLVENQGRVNYGDVDVEDFKGIWNVKINGTPVTPWKIIGFTLQSVGRLDFEAHKLPTTSETGTLTRGPQFLVGQFSVEGEPRDTFLDTDGWGKGVAYVNGWNLGRYWPEVGPQVTLYVPAPYLKSGLNELVVLELEHVPENRTMAFRTTPILG